jgi:hypothetical protein
MKEVKVRMDDALRAALKVAAAANKRSVNGEIVFRLQASVKSK